VRPDPGIPVVWWVSDDDKNGLVAFDIAHRVTLPLGKQLVGSCLGVSFIADDIPADQGIGQVDRGALVGSLLQGCAQVLQCQSQLQVGAKAGRAPTRGADSMSTHAQRSEGAPTRSCRTPAAWPDTPSRSLALLRMTSRGNLLSSERFLNGGWKMTGYTISPGPINVPVKPRRDEAPRSEPRAAAGLSRENGRRRRASGRCQGRHGRK
jgi:hypothetical protein